MENVKSELRKLNYVVKLKVYVYYKGAGLNSTNFYLASRGAFGTPNNNFIKFGIFHEVNNCKIYFNKFISVQVCICLYSF